MANKTMKKTKYKSLLHSILLAAAVTGLAACEATKEELGLTRRTPDEFAIIKRAPLEVPPSLRELPPPRPGAPRPQETPPQDEARSLLFGALPENNNTQARSGEAALLEQAGAAQPDPDIRDTVNQEAATMKSREKPVAEKLLGWATKKDKEPPATIVDPEKEAERLKRNMEEGKPVTDGETPMVEQ